MPAADPQPGQQGAGQSLAMAAEVASATMARVVAIVRPVVLLTVALMVRLRDPLAPVGPLDALLVAGSTYVLVTTFLPPSAPMGRSTHLFVVCDIALISGLIWYTGGVQSEYYLLYYLLILHGASLLNFRDAIMTSVLAAVSYLFIVVASGPLVPVITNGIFRAVAFGGSVTVLAVFFAVLAQEARVNRALTVRLHEALESVSAVYDVARAASTRDSVQDVLSTMLRQAIRLARADSGALAMVDDDGGLHVLARQEANGGNAVEFDQEMARQAIERREWLSRARSSPDPRQGAQELFVPLFAGRSPLAVLQVRSAPGGLSAREIELLRAMCAEGAMAIENVRLRAETKRAAMVDYLTGLCNRREFERRLEAEIRRTARHGGCVSLVLLDADDFKHCNDAHGHQAGDQVLQALAAHIESVIRSEDTAARYGGDEFAIVLPQTDMAGAHVVAQKIQQGLQRLRFGWAEDDWRLTVSVGVAACEDELSASLLLQKADRALYQAKGAGKNRICLWQRGAPTPAL